MRSHIERFRALGATVGLAASLACVVAPPQGVVYVERRPPPARVEVVGPARPGYVWVAGYWRWDRHDYVWVPGRWTPVQHGYRTWVSGRWEERHHRWYWVEGHWAR